MSRPADKTTSSANAKRAYRKGKPMSASERQLAAIARKRETHKEVKVFVKNPLKDVMIAVCEEEGPRKRTSRNYSNKTNKIIIS